MLVSLFLSPLVCAHWFLGNQTSFNHLLPPDCSAYCKFVYVLEWKLMRCHELTLLEVLPICFKLDIYTLMKGNYFFQKLLKITILTDLFFTSFYPIFSSHHNKLFWIIPFLPNLIRPLENQNQWRYKCLKEGSANLAILTDPLQGAFFWRISIWKKGFF